MVCVVPLACVYLFQRVVYDAEQLVLAIGQLLLGQQPPATPAAGL